LTIYKPVTLLRDRETSVADFDHNILEACYYIIGFSEKQKTFK